MVHLPLFPQGQVLNVVPAPTTLYILAVGGFVLYPAILITFLRPGGFGERLDKRFGKTTWFKIWEYVAVCMWMFAFVFFLSYTVIINIRVHRCLYVDVRLRIFSFGYSSY